MLVDILAKGGNLLFNIAPGPDGSWHEGAYALLREMGEWMDVNGEAIYETRAIPPYKENNVCFTSKKDGTFYAIYLAGEEESALPERIEISSLKPEKGSKVTLLDGGTKVNWSDSGDSWTLEVPAEASGSLTGRPAWVFKIEKP
jgi:alpha-L-fucosidase